MVLLVVEAEQVEQEGELGFLEVVKDVEVLIVIINFAGQQFEDG